MTLQVPLIGSCESISDRNLRPSLVPFWSSSKGQKTSLGDYLSLVGCNITNLENVLGKVMLCDIANENFSAESCDPVPQAASH